MSNTFISLLLESGDYAYVNNIGQDGYRLTSQNSSNRENTSVLLLMGLILMLLVDQMIIKYMSALLPNLLCAFLLEYL